MQVLCMGEALIDMLSTKEQNATGTTESFKKFAGGAPANVAVAVAKLGGDSGLFGKLGKDQFGEYLYRTLAELGVSTRFTGFSAQGKTALAFVGLDASGERSFDFYIDNAAHTDLSQADLEPALFAEPRIISFCSGSVSTPELRKVTEKALSQFRDAGSILCLDINLRPAFWDDAAMAPTLISETAAKVDIIKASHEELVELYGQANVEASIQSWLDSGVALILVTDGANPVAFYTRDTNGTYPTPKTQVVDTTAAGDAFVGGFLFTLAGEVQDKASFIHWAANFENILASLRFATQCGAFAVSRYGAFDALADKQQIEALSTKKAGQ
ncbi:MAG: sugar kinase [Alteromonadaceae bacterium]|nr:sugar kinase [Alteromonadaceae bacterium]